MIHVQWLLSNYMIPKENLLILCKNILILLFALHITSTAICTYPESHMFKLNMCYLFSALGFKTVKLRHRLMGSINISEVRELLHFVSSALSDCYSKIFYYLQFLIMFSTYMFRGSGWIFELRMVFCYS